MRDRPTSLAVSTLRRILSAALVALMLLTVAASPEAGTVAEPGPAGTTVEYALPADGTDDAPSRPEALPCHSAHHLCGKVLPLRPALAAGTPAVAHPEFAPAAAPGRLLLSDVTELPARPPRA